MKTLKAFFAKVAGFFTSGKAQKALDTVAGLVPLAMPFIDIAAQIAVGITPTKVDDKALAAVRAKFPRLFDSSLKTGEEVKLYMLGVASDLLMAKYPGVTTSIARSAVQLAYTASQAGK